MKTNMVASWVPNSKNAKLSKIAWPTTNRVHGGSQSKHIPTTHAVHKDCVERIHLSEEWTVSEVSLPYQAKARLLYLVFCMEWQSTTSRGDTSTTRRHCGTGSHCQLRVHTLVWLSLVRQLWYVKATVPYMSCSSLLAICIAGSQDLRRASKCSNGMVLWVPCKHVHKIIARGRYKVLDSSPLSSPLFEFLPILYYLERGQHVLVK